MSLYKPKNSPYWHFDFVHKHRRFHGSTGTADKSAARAVEAAERVAAGQGVRKRPAMTLDIAANRFYEERAKHQTSHKTAWYQIGNLVDGLGKDLLLSEIDGDRLSRYVARRRATVANSSANREIELLRAVMRRADKVWKADVGEMPDWGAIMLPEADERIRELGAAEEAALFAALRNDFKPMIRFAIWTGIRLSNVIDLTWRQVDFGAAVIRLKIKSKKPGGDWHVVPLTPMVAALLQVERGNHDTRVFTYECARSRQGRRKGLRYPFTQTGWRRPWRAALKAAGVTDFRFHDTRHTAATRTRREGGDLKVIQKMLGHKRIETTARYAHVGLDDVRAAMERAQSRNIPEVDSHGVTKQLKQKA